MMPELWLHRLHALPDFRAFGNCSPPPPSAAETQRQENMLSSRAPFDRAHPPRAASVGQISVFFGLSRLLHRQRRGGAFHEESAMVRDFALPAAGG